jgi:pimeloyl-ACP methyl ester carboxylesterase
MTVLNRWVGLDTPTSHQAGHGSHPCQGLYHYAPGTTPRVAFIATHYEIDFAEHYLAGPLATRGFGFLGWNTRFRGHGTYFLLEQALIDIGVGVRWLREVAGADIVVILGNSGGGSLMGTYQSQATEPHLDASRDLELPEAALSLPPADLYVSLNAHPGRPDVLTAWLDPAVTDETDPIPTDPDLDLFARTPPLDTEFVATYRAAQRARNHGITEWAITELARLGGADIWDRTFSVNRAWADPRFIDLTLDPSEREVGCYAGDPARANRIPMGLAATCTLRAWLSMWSLRESQCVGAPNLQRITVPSLVVQSMADQGVFPSDARAIERALGGDDTTLEFLPGAHYFEDVGPDAVADLIAAWATART